MARSYNRYYTQPVNSFAYKSKYCKSTTGKSLNTYSNKADAQIAAADVTYRYNTKYTPYSCNRCNKWHLSPKSRNTPSSLCPSCTGSDGKSKALYSSQKFAQIRSGIIRKEQKILVRTYRCPFNRGWHLTKASNYKY